MMDISEQQSEATFLEGYDPHTFERPSVAVDLVLLGAGERAMTVLLRRREAHPAKGRWALPGGFVGIDESVDDAAVRVLGAKAHLQSLHLEQLYTFGAVDRDPRMRVVSVAYIALLSADRLATARAAAPDLTLATLDVPWRGEAGGPVAVRAPDGTMLPLAFDHADILVLAMRRLRGRLDYTPIALALLPDEFTLRALQDVHEAIRGHPLNKPAFRRRMLDTGWLAPTGTRETGTSYRPAELYRHRACAQDES